MVWSFECISLTSSDGYSFGGWRMTRLGLWWTYMCFDLTFGNGLAFLVFFSLSSGFKDSKSSDVEV